MIGVLIYIILIIWLILMDLSYLLKQFRVIIVGESNRIRTVPEYGHSRYLRNHKSYKKNLMNKIFIII